MRWSSPARPAARSFWKAGYEQKFPEVLHDPHREITLKHSTFTTLAARGFTLTSTELEANQAIKADKLDVPAGATAA